MKKLYLLLILLPLTLLAASCSDPEFDNTPDQITKFTAQYWPGSSIETCVQDSRNNWYIAIKDGPSIMFSPTYSWVDIEGNGMPLPRIFLFDQLPAPLFEYLESNSMLTQVFDVKRTTEKYFVTLLNSSLTYSISTQQITQ